MNNYSGLLNSKSLNLIEKTINLSGRHLIDISDILYQYKILFRRIEILRALNVSTKLFLQKDNLQLNNEQKEAELFYLSILNNKDYQIDYHLFCDKPYRKIIEYYDPWSIIVEFKIYKDRVIKPAKKLYPDLKKFLEDTEVLLNNAIEKIENRITIIIPGKIKISEKKFFLHQSDFTL